MPLDKKTSSAFRVLTEAAMKEQDLDELEEFVCAIDELLGLLERRFSDYARAGRFQ
jgi:hypothetical protein